MNVAIRKDADEIFNARMAYDYAMQSAPHKLSPQVLQQINIEKYLSSNLVLDQNKTNQMQNARLATVTDIVGEVQKGERIVGTGDVVTPEIYQVLEGYRTALSTPLPPPQRAWSFDRSILLDPLPVFSPILLSSCL